MTRKTTIKYDSIYRTPIEFALQDANIQYGIVRRGVIVAYADRKEVLNAFMGRVSGEGYLLQ